MESFNEKFSLDKIEPIKPPSPEEEDDKSFIPDEKFVLKNKEIIVSFFAKHSKWYDKLKIGSAGKDMHGISLDSRIYMIEHQDSVAPIIPPLDVEMVTPTRAIVIANFFKTHPEAKEDLLIDNQ